ncbi:PREDICTED: transmembrane protease serine 9-like [Nicrophorus vespilloides]|uniref:Transmembrane protease serine 9-like n=1 Tax=Nicrophorus vespilloides TaxID=110193 RepID=A0ABM1MKP4_NICVS|nr:PREDICTED: transmembrane protease serine 9-like [Nicrophorus vespilloides]
MEKLFCFLLLLAVAKGLSLTQPYTLRSLGCDTFGFGRIIQGDVVEPHSIPYQVGLHISTPGSDRKAFCGGTLISENYVMTAAHCTDNAVEIEVVLGAHEITKEESTQVRIISKEFTVHEGWDFDSIQNDIALVKLSKPAPLNEYIKLAKLPKFSERDEPFEKLPARGSGWGKIGDAENTISPVLRKVDLTVISNRDCNAAYGVITDTQICSAGEGSKGPCNGDSGGPLVVNSDKQVGIASFVTDFGCEAGWPAGYCRVSKYLDWIAEHSDVKIEDYLATVALAQAQEKANFKSLDIVTNFFNIGLFNKNGRIVGGNEVKPNSIPYQVGLKVHMKDDENQIAFCGGSLISRNFVLTAAHCVEPGKFIDVILGAHKVLQEEPTQIRVTSEDLIYHEDWSMLTLRNDIALIKLPQSVELNENVQLVKLPTRAQAEQTFAEENSIASGWGKDSDKATSVSPVLRSVQVPVLDNNTCNKSFFGMIHASHICTKSEGGKSTCSGDSGGPLVLAEDNTQIGLVSFGVSFGCEIGWPAAYTRITYFLDWIEEHSDVKIE